MTLLARYLLRVFLPSFVIALGFFVMTIQLVDLFANLVRYLNLEIPIGRILAVQLLYTPRAISYALPIALLFAVGFTLGSLHSSNELIAVFASGVPIWRFVAPLIGVGLVLSFGSFWFHELVVIDTFRAKNEASRDLLNISRSFSNSNVTVRSPGGDTIYSAEYYNDATEELSRLVVLQRANDGTFVRRIDGASAQWTGTAWEVRRGTLWERPRAGESFVASSFVLRDDLGLTLVPARFQRQARDLDEMHAAEAAEWIEGLRAAGQPFRGALTDYYSRFSFSLTPFVVVLISSAIGGRFRRNVLLMSLLVALMAAVGYYVTGMVAGILASDGVISPLVGSWSAVALFTLFGLGLVRVART